MGSCGEAGAGGKRRAGGGSCGGAGAGGKRRGGSCADGGLRRFRTGLADSLGLLGVWCRHRRGRDGGRARGRRGRHGGRGGE